MSTQEFKHLSLTAATGLIIAIVIALWVIGIYYMAQAYPIVLILGALGWYLFVRTYRKLHYA